MPRMPASVAVPSILAVLVALEALGLMFYFAATAGEHGPESAGVFIGGVLLMVHAGQFVAGARHRDALARAGAIKKTIALAAVGAVFVGVGRNLEGEALSRPLLLAVTAGFVAPLAAIALLLSGRRARAWFGERA